MSEAPSLEMFPEYKTLVVSLEKPMLKICSELKPGLEQGDYGIIIGDDTSGRLPTLALKGFSDFVSEKNSIDKLPTIFLQSGTKVKDEDVNRQFNDRVLPHKENFGGKKALIITDYIQSGRSINRLMELFSSQGLLFDVVSLSISNEFDQSKLKLPESSALITAEVSPYIPSVWRRPALTGFQRANDSKDHRVSVIKGDMFTRKRVQQAREDIELLVKNITDQIYLSQ